MENGISTDNFPRRRQIFLSEYNRNNKINLNTNTCTIQNESQNQKDAFKGK